MRILLNSDDKTHITVVDNGKSEHYSTEVFAAMYGSDADTLVKPSEGAAAIMTEYPDYWGAAIALINAWSEYQWKRKLHINVTCGTTNQRVLDTIDKYYGGKLQLLEKDVRNLYADVCKKIIIFQHYCEKYQLATVDTMWLRENLTRDNEYRSLRGKCQRRKDAGKMPASLREIYHKGP